jgi:Tol biopolymer transport system component
VRVQWLNALSFNNVSSGRPVAVKLPAGLRFAAPDWSPDGSRLAFYAQDADGLSLWIAERDGSARTAVSLSGHQTCKSERFT